MRLLLGLMLSLGAGDWPQFRGPGGQGHSAETGLPVEWSESSNVLWKTAIPGVGWSSPVVAGGTIYLTTATEKGYSLRLVALDVESGRMVWNVEVFRLAGEIPIHQKNSQASPTPVLEGDRIYVHFGAHGTAAVQSDGKVVWRRKLEYYHRHGPGGSPALYKDLLIISCDGYDKQFVVALDKGSGEIRWLRDRKGYQAYATPLIVKVNGRDQAIAPGAHFAASYDPMTGEELWRVRYGTGYSNVPRPVFGHGLLFLCTGFDQANLIAVRPDGKGDVTDTHIAWTGTRGISLTPSPILVDEELYFVSDNGVATCLDARTGKQHWRQRLGGNFSASPIFAEGRIYFLSEECEATVLTPGKSFQQVAKSQLDGRCLASFAPVDRSLLVRTDAHLYRIRAAK